MPEGVFSEGRLDPECPILRRKVKREEFDEWLRKLPKGKSGGPDEMTYEMWQEALEVRKLSSGGETAAGGVDRSVYEAFSEEGRIGRRTR